MNYRKLLLAMPLALSAACGREKEAENYRTASNRYEDFKCGNVGRAVLVSLTPRDDRLFRVPVRYTDEDGDGLVDYYIPGPSGMLVADPSDTSLDSGERQLVAQGRYISRNSSDGISIQHMFDSGKAACGIAATTGN